MHIETKTIKKSLRNSKGQICTIMSSFFVRCKKSMLFGKLEKTKELLFAVFREKNI